MDGGGVPRESREKERDGFTFDFYLLFNSNLNWDITLGAAIKVGGHYIVDATTEEESRMSSAVSVSINRLGRICGLTKRGGAGLHPTVVLDMISAANSKHVSEQLMNKLDSEIAAAEACDEMES